MWEDSYPLLHIDQQIHYSADELKKAIDAIEAGIPEEVPEQEYWRSCPQMLALHRTLKAVHEVLLDPYWPKLKAEIEEEKERESDDEDRADAASY